MGVGVSVQREDVSISGERTVGGGGGGITEIGVEDFLFGVRDIAGVVCGFGDIWRVAPVARGYLRDGGFAPSPLSAYEAMETRSAARIGWDGRVV